MYRSHTEMEKRGNKRDKNVFPWNIVFYFLVYTLIFERLAKIKYIEYFSSFQIWDLA